MGLFSRSECEEIIPYSNPERYIRLDEKDFACLVRGGIVHCGNIHILLKDIGLIQMDIAIANAEAGIDIYKDHNKEG